jgi:hypothetical protein
VDLEANQLSGQARDAGDGVRDLADVGALPRMIERPLCEEIGHAGNECDPGPVLRSVSRAGRASVATRDCDGRPNIRAPGTHTMKQFAESLSAGVG